MKNKVKILELGFTVRFLLTIKNVRVRQIVETFTHEIVVD
jgi:hypothetical protein